MALNSTNGIHRQFRVGPKDFYIRRISDENSIISFSEYRFQRMQLCRNAKNIGSLAVKALSDISSLYSFTIQIYN